MPIFVLLLYVTLQYKSGSLLLYMCTFMTCCCFPPISRTIIRLNQVKFCWMLHVLAWVFFPRYTYAQESIFCFFPPKNWSYWRLIVFLLYLLQRADLRWNWRWEDMEQLKALQDELLDAASMWGSAADIFNFHISSLSSFWHEASGAKSMAVKFMKFQTSLL